MHGNGADGVVDMGNLLKEFDGKDYDYAAYDADGCRSEGGDCIAPGGNRHQTGECSVECHGDIGLLIPYPRQYHGCRCRHCGR